MPEMTSDCVVQIGIVVRDASQTARRYRELLGVHPWYLNEVDTRKGKGRGFHFRGRSIEAKARIAWARIGDLEIELIEPLDNESVYAEFLQQRGPGLHHVMFGGVDLASARAVMESQGIAVLAGGELQGTSFSLFDTQDALGLLCEIAEGGELSPDDVID